MMLKSLAVISEETHLRRTPSNSTEESIRLSHIPLVCESKVNNDWDVAMRDENVCGLDVVVGDSSFV